VADGQLKTLRFNTRVVITGASLPVITRFTSHGRVQNPNSRLLQRRCESGRGEAFRKAIRPSLSSGREAVLDVESEAK
jgi:hypothetical protein